LSNAPRSFVLAHGHVEARGDHLIFLGLHGTLLQQLRHTSLDEILHIA